MEFSHCGDRDLCWHAYWMVVVLFAIVTFTLTRWHSYTNLTRTPWRYTGYADMNFLHPGFRKLSSDRQTDRRTESTEIINHTASRLVKDITTNTYGYIIVLASCLIYVRALWKYVIFIVWVRPVNNWCYRPWNCSLSLFSVKNAEIVQLWV